MPMNLKPLLFNYLADIKKNNFVQALAQWDKIFRYVTPKRLWMANRLGLYATVLQQPSLPSKKVRVVKTIAQLKRQQLLDEEANQLIQEILQPTYQKFHQEFIKDIVYKYSKFLLEFIEKNHGENSYYLGLYLAFLLQSSQGLGNNREKVLQLLPKLRNNNEKNFILSNMTSSMQEKFVLINQVLLKFALIPLTFSEENLGFTINNLNSTKSILAKDISQGLSHRVSIIVTCYNAQDSIVACLQSLLQQSWQNIEIIVVDDASTDHSFDLIDLLAQRDSRVKLIQLTYNVGTYAAKTIGAQYTTGKFLTCQDADDWAHPQKIERQVLPLLNDNAIAVTTSFWLKIDEVGQYYARHYYPFLRQNPASPMFRKKQVTDDIGLWHIVRTGADSEFFERLKLYYGKAAVKVIEQPLTFASHRQDSLMTSAVYGAYEHTSTIDRLNYWESWRLWHIELLARKSTPIMPLLTEQILEDREVFAIPEKIKVNSQHIIDNLA